jgi:hypothetical protein
MMTQQLQASILTAPLPEIDRRALSQAWYSALHLARTHQDAAAPPRRTKKLPVPAGCRLPAFPRVVNSQRVRSGVTVSQSYSKRSPVFAAADSRRESRVALARKIEHAFLAPRGSIARSALTLAHGEARVHLVLQSSGERMRLIAICRPADRETVARALAQVRFALAARGRRLETEVGLPSCC